MKSDIEHMKDYVTMFITVTAILVLALLLIFLAGEANAQVVTVDMNKISMIESSGGKFKIHKDGFSKGTHGVSKITLKEWNNFHPNQQFSFDDLMDDYVSHKIANWYVNFRIPQMLRYYGKEDTLKNRLWAYNCGIKCVIDNRIPPITKAYFRKYGDL